MENPYWQRFCGIETMRHKPPIEPTALSRWRPPLKPLNNMDHFWSQLILAQGAGPRVRRGAFALRRPRAATCDFQGPEASVRGHHQNEGPEGADSGCRVRCRAFGTQQGCVQNRVVSHQDWLFLPLPFAYVLLWLRLPKSLHGLARVGLADATIGGLVFFSHRDDTAVSPHFTGTSQGTHFRRHNVINRSFCT